MSLPSLRESISALLGLVFRSRCEVCRADSDEALCAECASGFDEPPERICAICGLPMKERSRFLNCFHCNRHKPAFKRLRSLWLYDGALQKAITLIKFPRPRVRRRELADALMAVIEQRLTTRGNPLPGFKKGDENALVLPSPMHAKRLRQRGISLAAEFARVVSDAWEVPLREDLLVKDRQTAPQVRLAREERLLNVKDSFRLLSPGEIDGKICLVVDDVATTCATLNECARTLKLAGAERVYGLTIARQP